MREHTPDTSQNTSLIARYWEWIIAFLLTVVAVYLHAAYLLNAGGLWRDEAGFVHLATLPSLRDVWGMLTHDHSPILLPVIIRAWCAAGWGGTDFGLRVLGLIIGLLLPIAFWVASGTMRRGPPVISLTLLALNVTAIRAGDSLRAYGLGSILIVLTLVFVWHFTRRPAPATGILAALAAVLSVQCLYQNAFLVFAVCCGACVLCVSQREWQKAFCVVGMGVAAAVSLVPYVPAMARAQDWWALEKAGFHFADGWRAASTAMGSPLPWFNWVWLTLCLGAIWVASKTAWPHSQTVPGNAHRDLVLFSVVGLLVGIAGFAFFLKLASLPTQPWYYLSLMAFVAVCLDAILAESCQWARAVLIGFAIVTALAACWLGLPAIECRQTNVDLIAARLAKEAAPDDYIIVNPWYCGVTFQRYYQGRTPWTTLPPLDDHGLHRYDLLKIKMQMENPIQPVLDKVASTLQSGNRVWIVGRGIRLYGSPPPNLRPAPNNPWGWLDEPYSRIWGVQVGHLITTHAGQGAVVMRPSTNGVNSLENLPVVLITGWRLPPASTPTP